MANPARDARDKAQQHWPGATVHGRGRNWLRHEHPTEPGRFMLDTSIGPVHYGPGEDQEIDTAWVANTTDGFTHAMTTNAFTTRVRANLFNAGNIFRFEAGGQSLVFDPQSINWIDNNLSRQQIAVKQGVAGSLVDDIVKFANAYGTGIDFEYQNQTARLAKVITIDQFSRLPAPTVTGPQKWFEAEFSMALSSGIQFWIDGAQWDRSTRKATANLIEVRNSTGTEVLWWLGLPRAWDSAGNETIGQLEVRRQGGPSALFITVRVPYEWMAAAIYPVYVDPTLDYAVGAGADDGFRSSSGFNASDNTLYVGDGPGVANVHSFFRFTGVSGLSSTTITTAYFEPRFSNTGTAAKTRIYANDTAAPTAPTSEGTFDALALTTNYTTWDDATASDAFTQSPSIVSVIQELADDYDPSAIMILWRNNSSASSNYHSVRSYEMSSSWVAKLHIEYSTAAADLNINMVEPGRPGVIVT